MARTLIAILARDRRRADELTDALRDLWPLPTVPEVEVHLLEPQALADTSPLPTLILALADADEELACVDELLDRFGEDGPPILVMGQMSTAAEERIRFADGLVVAGDSDLSSVAGIVGGLVHRQPEIDRLGREVKVAERCQTGLQSEMARLHEELQLAAMVQRDHLPPKLPTVHGVEVSVMYRPAHYVSGDIYDAMRIDEDHLGVFLADVVGHGVPAALLTMGIARSLHTKEISGSAYRVVQPSEVLARLNQDMIRRSGDTTRFATAVYATIDCRSRVIRLASAGHPPALLCRADGSLEELETTGGLLGVFDGEVYGEVEAELGVDDTLLMYSDGFEQAFPDEQAEDPRLPSDRYVDVFRSMAKAGTLSELVERVEMMVDQQAGSLHQRDDLSLVCVRGHRLEVGAPRIAASQIALQRSA